MNLAPSPVGVTLANESDELCRAAVDPVIGLQVPAGQAYPDAALQAIEIEMASPAAAPLIV